MASAFARNSPYTARPFSLTANVRTNRTRTDARTYLASRAGTIDGLVQDLDAAIAAAATELAATTTTVADADAVRARATALRTLKRDYAEYDAALRDELDARVHDQAASSQYLAVFIYVLNRIAAATSRPRRRVAPRDFWGYDRAHMKERTREERKVAQRMKAVYAEALADRARLDRVDDERRALKAENAALMAEIARLRRRRDEGDGGIEGGNESGGGGDDESGGGGDDDGGGDIEGMDDAR